MDAARGRPALATLDVAGALDAAAQWAFRTDEGQRWWDWSLAEPDPRALLPVRRPRSSARSRHVPVWAYCTTTGDHVRLESGLEHDLLREVDRRADVSWVVAQPAHLRLPVTRRGRRVEHTLDLLTAGPDRQVTMWDVRSKAQQDEDFDLASAATGDACGHVGWRYRVYAGGSEVRRHNLMWLHAYRRRQPWYPAATDELRRLLAGGGSVGDVLAADGGAGHLVSAMWHAVWAGALGCDLGTPFTDRTQLQVPADAAPLPA